MVKSGEHNLHFAGRETETQKSKTIFPGSDSEGQCWDLNLNYQALRECPGDMFFPQGRAHSQAADQRNLKGKNGKDREWTPVLLLNSRMGEGNRSIQKLYTQCFKAERNLELI